MFEHRAEDVAYFADEVDVSCTLRAKTSGVCPNFMGLWNAFISGESCASAIQPYDYLGKAQNGCK